jgi:hypothetical protein
MRTAEDPAVIELCLWDVFHICLLAPFSNFRGEARTQNEYASLGGTHCLRVQFSQVLSWRNDEARRIFGSIDMGKTQFCSSILQNPNLNKFLKKNFNNCYLGDTGSLDDRDEVECRLQFFRGDWM